MRTITMCCAILALLCCPAFAGEPPATAPSGTRYAVRTVRITPAGLNELNEVIRDFAAEHSSLLRDHLTAQYQGGGDGTRWQLSLELPPNAPPTAKESLDQFLAKLPEALRAHQKREHARAIEPLERELTFETRRMEEAAAKAGDLRDRLREIAGRADVSQDGIHAAVAKLEEERQRLELDVMGKTARREALEEEIATQTALAQKKVEDDPISAELQKVVKAREEQIKHIQELHASGRTPQTELADAVAQAAEARAKLLERRREAAAEAGGATLQAFNRELLTLSVDLRELKARLDFVRQRLDRMRLAMDLLEPLSRAERELALTRDDYESARANLRQLQRMIELSKPPKIEILSSDNRPEP